MKKKFLYLTIILCVALFSLPVNAANPYCTGLKSTFRIIGEIVLILKIVIPLIIIIFGMIDLFKAVTSSKSDEITKSIKTLAFRLIAGILIFFLPSIIDFAFSLVESWSNYESDYKECIKCVLNVSECKGK